MKKKLTLFLIICTLLFSLAACSDKITVKFDTDGGSVISDVEVKVGETLVLPENPVKEGYVFKGWLLDGEPFDVNMKLEKNITLKANWEKENLEKYYVTFIVDGNEYKKEEYLENSLITKPTNPIKENYEFKGWFLGDTLFDFENTKITSNLTLVAKFEEKQSEERIIVYAVNQPEDILLFHTNRKEKENKKTEFFDLTQNYVVGDDNGWSIKPACTFYKVNTITGTQEEVVVSEWEYDIKVYLLNGDVYELLLENSGLIDSIDTKNCIIDFATSAVGSAFKVEVIPTGLTNKQLENVEDYTISFEFEVVEGYNVYNAKELGYMDNRTSGTEADAWKAFKEANNLASDYFPTNLIFHKNIDVTVNDIPGYFFYKAEELNKSDSDYNRALGSMKDYVNIYVRNIGDNQTFNILGNYYKLSAETLREVVRDDGQITPEGEAISHASLFKIEGSETGSSSIQNLNMIGNAPRVENNIKAGGQILIKVEGPAFTAYNNLAACFFITYFPNYTFTEFLMDKCKAYDSFNSFVYNWGSDKVTIKDCEMIGAGGPVIVQDHVRPLEADGGKVAHTKIINSKLESYVVGTEGWFTVVKASAIVPQIKALDALFTPFNKSFLKTNADNTLSYMNLICINKSGSAEGITAEKIKGSLKIDDVVTFDFGANDPYLAALLDQTFKNGAPAFQSSAGGYGYTNGQGLFDVTNTQIVDPSHTMYQGDYLCLYYNGMAITLGYNNAGEIYNLEA